ncbi:prolyl oligopeptidase family serine peptidase [Sphingomonas sp. PAMC 26605]|uniref:prolyl oligopeptidase family serine peptidase n=1 Tax=Sphingomonas sp. PAMC 26605 TaxID=1112214 RepID=UPI0012F50E42|nr:prolyl oligopeptidase family serine peptidase [Sphingomonas sp. PAMC 26605]
MTGYRARFPRLIIAFSLSVGFAYAAHAQLAQTTIASKLPLSINDVLAMEQLDRASISPDGKWVAAVVRRRAKDGEIFGRASYEIDPTRGDVWLISTETGERRALTNGLPNAAGFWCATWSPDGQRLAMLSTAPEGGEPRGGDNVRLYIWDRTTSDLSRLSGDAVMTQSRFGSPIDKLDLRGGADHETTAHTCHTGVVSENAPFLWLDDNRLLAVTLPKGEISIAVDQYARRYRAEADDAVRLRSGSTATVSVSASGDARKQQTQGLFSSVIQIIDVRTGVKRTVGTVPAYPFRSGLTASVSPDGQRLAVLASVSAFQPEVGRQFPNVREPEWTVERRLGVANLQTGTGFHWQTMSAASHFPLELYGWSPNSQDVAIRARASQYSVATPLFIVNADKDSVRSLGSISIGNEAAGADRPRSPLARWANDRKLFARASDGKWWLLSIDGRESLVSGTAGLPSDVLVRDANGSLTMLIGKGVFRLDPAKSRMVRVSELGEEGRFLLFNKSDAPSTGQLTLLHSNDGGFRLATLNAATGVLGALSPATGGDILDVDLERGRLLYSQSGRSGISLLEQDFSTGKSRELLKLNTYLNKIDWGDTRLVQYQTPSGGSLNAAVLLPPGYQSGRSYPTLAWVYGGYDVRSLENDFMTDPLQPGLYNLRLYAAKGYVVVVPSMPLDRSKSDIYSQLPTGVMSAIDKLVSLGISDPERLGVIGQSFGGYSVYGLLGQTSRFKAAVAIAGLSDLSSLYGEFDPTGRGYPNIEHEKSDNWFEIGQFGEQFPPWGDPAGYALNSPLSHVDHVTTPLLMIHGDADLRGNQAQAERFFFSLYAQGKTAELRRYGGESHSVSQSPANIRDAFEQTIIWFDRYLRKPNDAAKEKP